MPRKSLTKEEFVLRASKVHNNKYNYSLSNYKTNKSKIKIICVGHGVFEQTPSNHLKGNGCKKCFDEGRKLNTQEFIQESKKVHGNTYIYSATTYQRAKSKVIITCKIHGNFKQVAYSHKQGRGCPICSESKGEREVRLFLENHDIKYLPQKTFPDCKNINLLSFDFYLPDFNLCIEYDGEQHFKPMGFSGGMKGLKRVMINDKIKNQYCKINNINLLRIKYTENVNESLNGYNFLKNNNI